MLRRTIVLFGAIVCASPSIILDGKYDVYENGRGIFSNAKSNDHRSIPSYYVSYDTYHNTCTDERCNDVADVFLRNVKKSSSPCNDFHGFACGKKQNKMGSLTEEIQEILEEKSSGNEEMKSLTLEKKFYRSCMEQPEEADYRTRREFSRLLDLSNGLGLFRADRKLGQVEWQSIDGLYASLGFEHAFFSPRVTRDPQNSDVNLISIQPPSPLYSYSVHGLLKYNNFTSGITSNLLGRRGETAEPYVTNFEDVIDFNNALHEILPPLGMFEENITTLVKNKMTVSELQRIYDSVLDTGERENEKNQLNWLKVLNTFLRNANIHIDGNEKIVLRKIEFFTKLAELLDKTSPVTVEKYVHFRFLTQISKYLNPRLARFFENIPNRAMFCIKQSENQLIGAAYEYIRRHVPYEQKINAEKIMENVRDALIDLLSNAKWMDNKTKLYATNKLKNLEMVIGFPDWLINKTIVNNYYGNLHLRSNFFENTIKYKRKALINELRGLKHPRMFDSTTMSRRVVPLIYHIEVNSHVNQILFPAAYLNENKYKLFSPKLPSAINYGSFGSMLGSILYDYVSLTDNLKYNEFYTRTIGGLTKETIDAYKIKEKCLSNQLINYKKSASDFGQPLASVIDRDTIQVDKIYEKMVGLRAAFEAYKKVERVDENVLPGFENMSNQQLFFLSYAERICEIGDVYDRYDAYEASLKVNGVVSNLEAFSRVYQCPVKSAMNGEAKCELFS